VFQLDELRPHKLTPPRKIRAAGAPRRGPEREAKSNAKPTKLPFNQPYVSSPRTFLGFLDGELDALAFPKQLEHRAPHGAAMKEMLQAGFIPDETKAFVD
jgi:hypothetical protein